MLLRYTVLRIIGLTLILASCEASIENLQFRENLWSFLGTSMKVDLPSKLWCGAFCGARQSCASMEWDPSEVQYTEHTDFFGILGSVVLVCKHSLVCQQFNNHC